MRKSSAAKRLASSPPVPARISKRTFRSSFGFARQEQQLESLFEPVVLGFEAGQLLEGHRAHVLIRVVHERLVALDLLLELLPRPVRVDDLLEVGPLLAELRELFPVADDVRRDEQVLELDVSSFHRG
jgi:hypothetical protein